MKNSLLLTSALALGLASTTANAEPQAEVLHWWTSGGEAAAVKVLMEDFTANGGTWTDMPVAGGGGDAAMTALRARVLSGNAPTAVQLVGPSIQEWFEEGALANINDLAQEEDWDNLLPQPIQYHLKCDGNYCAAPVNIHRVDWIWGNSNILNDAGIEPPKTWAEFNAAAEKLQGMGILPLAHGGQAWQDATLFEAVVVGLGGPEFYKRALVDLDMDALKSDQMVEVFDQMRTLRGYVDDNFSGRDWNLATAMVINGEAAFQIMGDWAKGEFIAAGKEPGKDFTCSSPSNGAYLYNVDSFAFFNVDGEDRQAGQKLLASLTMGKNFQKVFNLNKGSIPARMDVSMDEFDSCGVQSKQDLGAAIEHNALLPSFAHGMAMRGAQAGAVTDVVTAHFNSDMSSEEAVAQLAQAVAASQ